MNKRLLIIDDDRIFAKRYEMILSMDQFDIQIAGDGESGLKLVSTFKPDIVLLDLMLPRVSGIDVLKQIRAAPETLNLPVLVLTNAYLPNQIDEAKEAGANRCLIKIETPASKVAGIIKRVLSEPEPAVRQPKDPPLGENAAFDEAKLNEDFFRVASDVVRKSQVLTLEMLKSRNITKTTQQIQELLRYSHLLTGAAALSHAYAVAWIASAIEALLKQLLDHPGRISTSTSRTVAQGIDLLEHLLKNRETNQVSKDAAERIKVLAVDDEAVSLSALVHALKLANLEPATAATPRLALQLLESAHYDLVITDVKMPEMSGFEFCKSLRALPGYATTPVIFVTGLNGFEDRKNAAMVRADDFIAKPFLLIELAVKAVVHVLSKKRDSSRALFQSFSPRG